MTGATLLDATLTWPDVAVLAVSVLAVIGIIEAREERRARRERERRDQIEYRRLAPRGWTCACGILTCYMTEGRCAACGDSSPGFSTIAGGDYFGPVRTRTAVPFDQDLWPPTAERGSE